MSLPLVSVVIPTYNYGHLVGEAVESVLAQTYPNVETIVVDDGSTDDTRERLAAYEDRIRYHYQPNAGLSAARNTGIGLAQGELIALLDSDDMFHREKLAIQVDWMQRDPSIDLCTTDCIEDQSPHWGRIDKTSIRAEDISLRALVLKSRFGSCGVVVRKKCFQSVGLFDTALRSAEDRDMWIRIAARHRIVKLSAQLWWYRPTPGSMSRNAAKMEHFEHAVLDKAFVMPELRGKLLLKCKAYALAAYAAAYRYRVGGERGKAVGRMVRSFGAWPLPIHVPEVRVPFDRTRLFLRTLIGAPRT